MQSQKCIIFSRVSSERQSYDEQTLKLRQLAEESGYPPDSHFIIEYKESGIRLKEEERLGLNEMKELISSDAQINCVFASEISRIARSKKVLFSIQDFLVQRKIQLVIYEPRIILLNKDSTINDAADFAFTMYAQYAESEMRQKQERFKRGRERSKREGKWHGGRVLLGFRIEDKRLIPDESLAPVIRRMFEMYRDGQTQEYLAKYLYEFGIRKRGYNMSKLLGNPLYVRIVGQELYDAVQKAKVGRKCPPKYRLYSPGEKLLKCLCCGRHFVHITNCYICLGRIQMHDCEKGFSVSDKYVDALLTTFAKYGYAARLHVTRKDDEERIRQVLEEIPRKQNAAAIERQKLVRKIERTYDLYTDGVFEKPVMERRVKTLEKQIKMIDDASARLFEQETTLRVSLKNMHDTDATIDTFSRASARQIYELVHQEIEEVEVYRVGKFKYLKFNMKAGFSNLARFSGQGCSFKCEIEANGIWTDFILDK